MDNGTLKAAKASREMRNNRVLMERILKEIPALQNRIAFLEDKLGEAYAPEEAPEVVTPSAAANAIKAQESISSAQEEANAPSNPLKGGLPDDLDELRAICEEYGIKFHPNAKVETLKEKIEYHFLTAQAAE